MAGELAFFDGPLGAVAPRPTKALPRRAGELGHDEVVGVLDHLDHGLVRQRGVDRALVYSAEMPRYAAFLRGINLGSRRRVSGADLRARFEEMGFRDVATFRTSGNVIFGAGRESQAKMVDRIEEHLARVLGYGVDIFLRTGGEIRAISDHQPFARNLLEASHGKLQVALLSAQPATRARTAVLALATDDDRLAFGDRELYWLPSGGTQRSALDVNAIGKLLGSTTMRTKGTIDQLAAKHFVD